MFSFRMLFSFRTLFSFRFAQCMLCVISRRQGDLLFIPPHGPTHLSFFSFLFCTMYVVCQIMTTRCPSFYSTHPLHYKNECPGCPDSTNNFDFFLAKRCPCMCVDMTTWWPSFYSNPTHLLSCCLAASVHSNHHLL